MEVWKQFSNNGYLSSQHSVTFPKLIWFLKLSFCLKFEPVLGRKDAVLTSKEIIYGVRGSSIHSYTSEGGQETLVKPWLSVLMIQRHIYQADLVPKIGYFV